jgi:hypothetical protein
MTGLFLAMWFSWVGFTLYANRFDTDDIVFRIAKLAATGAIAGCAANASDAIGKLAVPFAACYLGSRLVLLALSPPACGGSTSTLQLRAVPPSCGKSKRARMTRSQAQTLPSPADGL